jgi:hypothetical protein
VAKSLQTCSALEPMAPASVLGTHKYSGLFILCIKTLCENLTWKFLLLKYILSGGPLLVLGTSAEEDILVGAVSWGAEPCGELPGVFQRMSESSKWIKGTVCVNSMDVPPGYCPSLAPSLSPTPIARLQQLYP